MASFSNKISVLIDVTADKASASLKGFKADVAGADGVLGKLKVGGSAAFESLKANAGNLAMAGGAALLAFGVKAVAAFTDAADAARSMGTATGLSTEEASRWISVADDVGVSAESLSGAVGKVAKSLDATKWAEYGIATRDAAGLARSTNDIMLDSLDALGKITNETERAKVGNELFGKSYASLAPMIGKTRAEFEEMLGSVAKGEVITEKEAAKALRLSQAQDSLSDALNEVTLAFGEIVAGMAPMIERGAELVSTLTDLDDKLGVLDKVQTALDFSNPITAMTRLSDVSKDVIGTTAGLWEYAQAVSASVDVVSTAGAVAEDAAGGVRDMAEAHREAERGARDQQYATQALDATVKRLLGTLDADEAWLSLQDNMDQFAAKMLGSEGNVRAQSQAIIDAKQDLIGYTSELAGVPAVKKTEILALIEQGKLQEAYALIAELTKDRTVTVNAKAGSGWSSVVGSGIGTSGVRAAGGPVARNMPYLVGERGPEVVVPGQDGSVIANNRLGGGQDSSGSMMVTINMPPGSDGADVVRAIKDYERRNGRGWRG